MAMIPQEKKEKKKMVIINANVWCKIFEKVEKIDSKYLEK